MPFTSPAALWLLPAVALPIVFHLFFRLRRQVREFPSLMFFLRIDPRLSAKRKIHEWLILLLRCLFLLLLILALARPRIGVNTSAEKIARLVLIDNSGSMSGPTAGSISKLTLACRATRKLIASARPGDQTAVQLMQPDPTSSLPPGFDAAPATLSDAVGKIEPSDGAAPVAKSIRSALAQLDGAKAAQRELHIVTDLQQKNWSRGELGALATHAHIIVHRIDSAALTSGYVSLDLADLPVRAIPAGRVTPIQVILKNEGPVAASVHLNGADDSGGNFSREMSVPPNASAPATVTFSFATPGFHWAQVWLEGDAAPTANRAGLGFWVIDVQKVLFTGVETDFGAMPYAVSPGGNANLSGLDATIIGEDQLVTSLAAKPLAVVLTWEDWPKDGAVSSALENYVREGGTLFLVPAADSGVTIAPPMASWIDANSTARVTLKEPEPVVVLQDGDAIWRNLRDADGRAKLGDLRTLQYRPVRIGSGWDILFSSAKGATLLARRSLGRGRIFASGLAFTPQWSSLPLKASFVVLMQNAIFGDIAEHIPVQSIHAGDEIHFEVAEGPLVVKSLAGSALEWHGQVREFEGLPRAGVYELTQQDHITWVAVAGNPEEAAPLYLPRGLVPLLRDVPHDVIPLTTEEDILRSGTIRSSGATLYRWLLLSALVVLLIETWLGNERSSEMGRKLFASLLPSNPARKTASAPAVSAQAAAKKPAHLTRV